MDQREICKYTDRSSYTGTLDWTESLQGFGDVQKYRVETVTFQLKPLPTCLSRPLTCFPSYRGKRDTVLWPLQRDHSDLLCFLWLLLRSFSLLWLGLVTCVMLLGYGLWWWLPFVSRFFLRLDLSSVLTISSSVAKMVEAPSTNLFQNYSQTCYSDSSTWMSKQVGSAAFILRHWIMYVPVLRMPADCPSWGYSVIGRVAGNNSDRTWSFVTDASFYCYRQRPKIKIFSPMNYFNPFWGASLSAFILQHLCKRSTSLTIN
jgi:hypothetical protein